MFWIQIRQRTGWSDFRFWLYPIYIHSRSQSGVWFHLNNSSMLASVKVRESIFRRRKLKSPILSLLLFFVSCSFKVCTDVFTFKFTFFKFHWYSSFILIERLPTELSLGLNRFVMLRDTWSLVNIREVVLNKHHFLFGF